MSVHVHQALTLVCLTNALTLSCKSRLPRRPSASGAAAAAT